ncbi:MAG: hypothetical protein JXB48_24705 [Candidatus Latescibacteria bacterium]|nr:hypothetical protein [Candidatus Latescibacterota bacterium]
MKGLKKYKHKEREQVVNELVPLIKKRVGKNLVALAAQGSFARNEDIDYSDLELIAFVKKIDRDKKIAGMGKIRNGLLVELIYTTKESYIKEVKEPTESWYIAGSDKLMPIINKTFIERLNRYKAKNLKKRCLNHAAKHWYEVQESTAKVFNAVLKKNRTGIPLLVFDMYLHMLRVLSFLNQHPYTTFSKFIEESMRFKTKPRHFYELTKIVVEGKYQHLTGLRKTTEKVFSEFENIFDELGFDLYYDNLDPGKPMKDWAIEK